MEYRQNRFKIPGGGVIIPWAILNGNAYKDLTPSAAKILPFFLGKVKCGKRTGISYGSLQYYNFEFNFSYREAKRYGFASSTYSDSIKALVGKGFVDPVARGGMKGTGLSYSWFKLSARWQDYKTSKFVEIKWQTLIPKPRKQKKGYASPFLPSTNVPEPLSTSKSEIDSANFRNNAPQVDTSLPKSKAVAGVRA